MTLPAGVDAQQIKATTHDGVVEMTIPLPKEAKKQTITITPTAGWLSSPTSKVGHSPDWRTAAHSSCSCCGSTNCTPDGYGPSTQPAPTRSTTGKPPHTSRADRQA